MKPALSTTQQCEHAAAIHGVQQHRGPFGECDREPCASAHLQALREYERSMLGGAAANKMLAVERDRTVEQYRDRLAEVNAENATLRRGMICGECSQNTSHRGGAWWTDEYLTMRLDAKDREIARLRDQLDEIAGALRDALPKEEPRE